MRVADARDAASGMVATAATKVLLSLVVGALFMERIEKDEYASGSLPFPDTFFLTAAGLLALKLILDTILDLSKPRPYRSLDGAIGGLVMVLGLLAIQPAVQHDYAGQTIKTFVHLICLLLAALVIGRALTPDLLKHALRTYFVLAVGISLVAVIQTIELNVVSLGLNDTLGLRSRASGDFLRPLSVFSEPAYLGYAALAGVLIGCWFFYARPSRLLAAGIGCCAVTMLLAAAMGPIAIAGALGVFMVATGRIRNIRMPFVFASAIIAAVLVLSPAGATLMNRTESIVYGSDASASARTLLNRGSIDVWHMEPVTGVGLGNSRFYLVHLVHIPGIQEETEFQAANVYLALLGESGPLGVLALGLTLLVLLRGRDQWRDLSSPETLSRFFILMMAMQFFIIGNFLLPPFWFWVGLRLATQREEQEMSANA